MANDERKERARVLLTELLDVLFEDVIPAQPTVYGSRAPYAPPPRRSHRWMRDHGPELVPYGAIRTGGKSGKGVTYTMSADDFENYQDAKRSKMPTVEAPAAPATPAASGTLIDIDSWIAKGGYRPSRGSR